MKLYTFLTILLIASVSFSQYKNIKVNQTENSPEEVSIAINPTNPLNIVIGANINNEYFTFDKGVTWDQKTLESKDYGVWGDPCVIFDKNGISYYFHLAFPPKLDRIICHKSNSGGVYFNNPGSFTGYNTPKQQDKQWACADWTRDNYVYVCWTQFDKYGSKNSDDHSNIMFSYSSNAGTNWSDAVKIDSIPGDCLDSSNTVEGAVPCTGPNGEIYVSWSGPAGIMFNRSTDAGKTWLNKEILAADQVGGWNYDIEGIYRCNGMAVTGCDISSGPHKGTIYINFSDIRNGKSDVDVFLCKSTDGGNNWSKPKRVNDDKFGNSKQQFMNAMYIDPISGAINILFYDRRNYDDKQTDVYLARSTDGGETFTNIKISETPFTPAKKVFFGDYIGVCSYDDFVASTWMRMDGTMLTVWYCGIDFKNK